MTSDIYLTVRGSTSMHCFIGSWALKNVQNASAQRRPEAPAAPSGTEEPLHRTLGPQSQTCHDLPISQTMPNLYLQYYQYWQYPMSPGLWLDEPGPEAQSFALGIISTSRAQIVWGRLGGHGVDYRIQPGDVVQQSQNTKRNSS